jgi:hypothetical protein
MTATKVLTVVLGAALLSLPASARADDDPKPIATAKLANGVVVDVLSVSVDGTQDKLKVVWRYTNPTKQAIRLVAPTGKFAVKNPPYREYFEEVNYRAGKLTDNNAIRYQVVRTADNKYYDATDIRRLGIVVPAGGNYEMYAKFPLPQSGEKTIHLQLPDLPQFENLTITQDKKKD